MKRMAAYRTVSNERRRNTSQRMERAAALRLAGLFRLTTM
jgi:hypothetical protein